MVDARDLKSLGGKPLCRFESGRPHHGINDLSGYSLLRAAASNAHVGTVSACAGPGLGWQFVVRHRRCPEVFDAIIEDALRFGIGARIALTFVPG